MKIEIKHNAYDSLIEKIVKRTNSFTDTLIVRIKTSVLGVNTVIMYPNDWWYEFDTDWYEGGDLELLGFIRLQDITVPELT